jgi:hypothetical protein
MRLDTNPSILEVARLAATISKILEHLVVPK